MAENKLITLKNLESIAKALDNKTKSLVVAEMDRASGAEAEILDAIAAVESMLGGKSIVYKTQEEYDNLSDEEKDDDTVTYFITDAEDTSHKHENPDVLDALTAEDVEVIKSVGETLENLEKELFDVEAKTIELDVYKADKKYVDEKIAALNVASNDVFQNNVSNGKLELTLDKYQIATISSGTEIVFPEVDKFTEIHLYFDKDESSESMDLILPDNCQWRVDANITEGTSFELVAIYNTRKWLVNILSFSSL